MILPAAGPAVPDATLVAAVEALRGDAIVGIPTDTVYGLAVDPFVPGAADRVFRAKRRPRGVELPVLVADRAQAESLTATVPPAAAALMDRFWPGALTLVLPRRPDVPADLGDNGQTIGVRWPASPVAQALCAKAGPLATTSANRHGEPPAETAEAVEALFGEDVAVVLDGGRCAGAPSTVVDCTGRELRLLREGRIPWSDIAAVAGNT